MLYAKMICGTCGNPFEIYHSEFTNRETPIRCPHCLRQMDGGQWETLRDAFFTAADWNRHSRKASLEHGKPLFHAEFVSRNVPYDEIINNTEEEE